MKRYGTLELLFGEVDLSFAEAVVNESYHVKDSVGKRKNFATKRLSWLPTDDPPQERYATHLLQSKAEFWNRHARYWLLRISSIILGRL